MYAEFLTLDTLCSLSRNSHSLTSRHSLFFCAKFITRTHMHANASILSVSDVRLEGLAINSLKAQA